MNSVKEYVIRDLAKLHGKTLARINELQESIESIKKEIDNQKHLIDEIVEVRNELGVDDTWEVK